ncbi:MAG: FliG C-terminal domain-containing protein [Pseudomonadota bacterium]
MSQVNAARRDHSPRSSGAARAAALMRALGDEAAPVWSVLTAQEAHLIAGEMQHLPPDNPGSAERTLAALLDEDAPGRPPVRALVPGSVWHRLEEVSPRRLAVFLAAESAQAAAIILSRISPSQAGATVRALPEDQALAVLHRMVAMTPPNRTLLETLETALSALLDQQGLAGDESGAQKVAELLETLGSDDAPALLDALTATGPEQADQVRRLMVPFEALADFPPAGLQTLLADLNHDTLALALKGSPPALIQAVFRNMTQRAGSALREDMDALGAVPRRDVDAARAAIVAVARELIRRGDIRPAGDEQDQDLIA